MKQSALPAGLPRISRTRDQTCSGIGLNMAACCGRAAHPQWAGRGMEFTLLVEANGYGVGDPGNGLGAVAHFVAQPGVTRLTRSLTLLRGIDSVPDDLTSPPFAIVQG